MRTTFLFLLTTLLSASAAEWQWSVPTDSGRAFLWIPPDCQQVRAVVVAQNNRAELGILESPIMRQKLAQLGLAEIWISPPFDSVFRFDHGAGDRFNAMMKSLADASGYSELNLAPVVPIGDAICASYPWNFAAWDPGRTLAAISIHGDAPLTDKTGTGLPNPQWGPRNIDGVPGLMVMAEYEWEEDRIVPALNFRKKFPQMPLAMLAEPGHGHFEYSDELLNFLAMFIDKAAQERLPATSPVDQPVSLKPVDPESGWLVERWTLDKKRTVAAAPVASYKGDPAQAFWCFDQEMAQATENFGADQIGKKPQLIAFVQEKAVAPSNDSSEQVDLRFLPEADGITFKLKAAFLDEVPAGSMNLMRWSGLPVGSKVGHATGGGPIVISKIYGPVLQTDPDTFAISFDRYAETTDNRNDGIWFEAIQPGDTTYKRMVEQAIMHIAPISYGTDQHITFPQIADQNAATKSLPLTATSDAGMPVHYYVREGPAEIDGNTLKFTAIPPRSKFPVEVTVVAWQWGRSLMPAVKTATPLERTFSIVK